MSKKNAPLKVILLSSSGTMTIGKLKGLLYRLFKVDSTDQQLSCVDSKVITANFIPFFSYVQAVMIFDKVLSGLIWLC